MHLPAVRLPEWRSPGDWEELARVLLCDLSERNDRVSMEHLKGPERPFGNLIDFRTVSEFARELCERKGKTLYFVKIDNLITVLI